MIRRPREAAKQNPNFEVTGTRNPPKATAGTQLDRYFPATPAVRWESAGGTYQKDFQYRASIV